MSIFGGKTTIFAFLNNSSLRLARYRFKDDRIERLDSGVIDFTDITVKDSAINDVGGFYKKVKEFLDSKTEWAGSGIIFVMPEEKIFLKGMELDLGDLDRKQEIIDDFVNEVPFEKSELIVRERLVGKVMELSAIHDISLGHLQKPFAESGFKIIGVLSIPQVLSLSLQPKEKRLLMAFYDNDLAFALAENASVIFSETARLTNSKIKEAMKTFNDFINHVGAKDIKTISLIVGDEEAELQVKNELENQGYKIKEVRRADILDFTAEYYAKNSDNEKDWNLLLKKKNGKLMKMFFSKKNILIYSFLALLIISSLAAAGWLLYIQYSSEPAMAPTVETEMPEEVATTTEPAETEIATTTLPVAIPDKSEFSVDVFNGTFAVGEATRFGDVLEGAGFTVGAIGNYENQNQTRTTLVVGEEVPDSIVGEVRGVLEQIYREVVISVSPVLEKNISIIIGTKK